jgi:hypothetical protein
MAQEGFPRGEAGKFLDHIETQSPVAAYPLGNERDAKLMAQQSGRPVEQFLGDGIIRRAVIVRGLKLPGTAGHRIIELGEPAQSDKREEGE